MLGQGPLEADLFLAFLAFGQMGFDLGLFGGLQASRDIPRQQALQLFVAFVMKSDDASHVPILEPVLEFAVEEILQLLTRMEHARLHRAHGAVHDLGDLPIAGVVIVGQVDHHAVGRR